MTGAAAARRGRRSSAPVAPALVVERTGPLMLVQDAGRPGHGGIGVSPSGALDPRALADVAALLGIDPREVVERHTSGVWTVAFGGFAPGFGYLAGVPGLEVPRRTSPRPRVPAGAVALAGEFSGIYPRVSPGGWQLIGTTRAVLWDPEREPAALLQPGSAVRFREVDA